MIAASLTDISNFNGVPVDLAIGLDRPPLAQHPNLVFWLLHRRRSAYDQVDHRRAAGLLHYPARAPVRATLSSRPTTWPSGTKACTRSSRNISTPLQRYDDAWEVCPPPPLAERRDVPAMADYIYFPKRMSPPKRQDLVVEALAHTKSNIRLVFHRRPQRRLLDTIVKRSKELGVADRIEWRDERARTSWLRYAESLAVVCTAREPRIRRLEAMLSQGRMLTCRTDSVGFSNSFFDAARASSAPRTSFDRAGAGPAVGGRPEAGEQAYQARYDQMGVSWPLVISRLTRRGAEPGLQAGPRSRRRVARPERIHGAIKAEAPLGERSRAGGPEDLSRYLDTARATRPRRRGTTTPRTDAIYNAVGPGRGLSGLKVIRRLAASASMRCPAGASRTPSSRLSRAVI